MGPQVGLRCLLCRQNGTAKHNYNIKSCASSLCTIFGLPANHPFKVLYEKAHYCNPCLKELHEADVTLAKLELMRQNLLRFQNRVYSKLGDNYFQIKDKHLATASYEEFESGDHTMHGRKFSYDEIIKVVYEKLDRECFKWERFSSEGKLNSSLTVGKTGNVSTTAEACTQTDNTLRTSESPTKTSGQKNREVEDVDTGAWDYDDDGGGTGSTADDDEFSTGQTETDISFTVPPASDTVTSSSNDLVSSQLSQCILNFDDKVYCSFDPENCKRYFFDQFNLAIHVKSFHLGNSKPYECLQCKKSFIDETRLKSHELRVHTPFGVFICEHCGKGCATQGLLRDHVRKVHEKTEVHVCCFCSAPFNSRTDMEEHENQHRANKSPFDCVFCSEHCANSTTLKSHYINFHTDSTFTCDVCGKLFASENGLRLHKIVHTEAFKCDQCAYTGTSQSALTNHKMSHSNDKRFTCEICGAAYKYAKNLVVHHRVHTGEKPYFCKVCNSSFREKSYLKRHEESHSAYENYECLICKKGFKVKENLKKHLRLHNGYVKKKKPRSGNTPPRVRKSRSKKILEEQLDDTHEQKVSPLRQSKMKSPKRKKNDKPPAKKKSKKSKNKTKRNKKHYYGEDSGADDDIQEMETQKIEMETQKIEIDSYGIGNEVTEEEINSAVASIQPTVVVGQSSHVDTAVYSNSTVYTTHFRQSSNVQELIPVAVISTQGQTASGSKTRGQVQYQFGYLG